MRLADEVLALHLTLAVNVNDLFEQLADELLVGEHDGGQGEAALRAAIARDLRLLRERIAAEVPFRGLEEVDELERLSAIEG